jgi:cytolysin (calcineurin-like family phosphatase)
MTGNKYKNPLFPIEYEEESMESSYDEMSFERVTFTKDFGPIRKGSYYNSVYISLDLGYILLSNGNEEDDEVYDIEFKIKEAND